MWVEISTRTIFAPPPPTYAYLPNGKNRNEGNNLTLRLLLNGGVIRGSGRPIGRVGLDHCFLQLWWVGLGLSGMVRSVNLGEPKLSSEITLKQTELFIECSH